MNVSITNFIMYVTYLSPSNNELTAKARKLSHPCRKDIDYTPSMILIIIPIWDFETILRLKRKLKDCGVNDKKII